MYTEENMTYNDNYDDEYIENNTDGNNGSIWTLLLRILIIFLCLLLIIWIISKFVGGKKINNDGVVFNNNLDTIRLASEKYFFIGNNLPENENDSITISLSEMNTKGLVSEVKDYENKVCSTKSDESFATIKKTNIAYELVVKLTCNKEQKEITYYYDLENMECLSCNGNTYMDGTLADSNDQEEEDNSNEFTDTELDEIDKLNINCNNWSPWTSIKIEDNRLIVKTRTLYKGYKTTTDGIKTTYGEWSSWSETPIAETSGIEVETKDEVIEKWSDNKTTTSYITNSDTIKVISASSVGTEKNCSTSWKQVRETVSASKYFDLNEDGLVIAVHDTYYDKECDNNCNTNYQKVYDITYKKKSTSCTGGDKITMYTYQELEKVSVKMYRSRTVKTENVKGETIYSDWVSKLEKGYIKTDEKIEYSYKDTSCKG